MKSFLRSLVSIFTVLFFLIFLLLSTLRFQLLNPDFLITSLKKPEIYEHTQTGLKAAVKEAIKKQYQVEVLTTGERARLDQEISNVTDLITAERLQDLTENNIQQILAFVHGKKEKLILYLPLKDWGLPSALRSQKPFVFLSEETDLEKLIDVSGGDFSNIKEVLIIIGSLGETINIAWIVSACIVTVLLLLHYLLSTGPHKIQASAWLLIKIAIITSCLSALLKAISDNLAESLHASREPSQILISTLAPPVLSGIIRMWFTISIIIVILGIVILETSHLVVKRKPQ